MSADARLAEGPSMGAPRFDRCEVGGHVLLGVSAVVDDALEPRVAYLVVAGEICPASIGTLTAMLDDVLSDGVTELHLDLSKVDLCTSYGVDAFDDARRRVEARGGSMHIVGAHGVVRRVLDLALTGFEGKTAAGADGQAPHR